MMQDDDQRRESTFADGEPVRGLQKTGGMSGVFIIIISMLMIGAILLGYLALRGCNVTP